MTDLPVVLVTVNQMDLLVLCERLIIHHITFFCFSRGPQYTVMVSLKDMKQVLILKGISEIEDKPQ